jgi:predicted RNA methylase
MAEESSDLPTPDLPPIDGNLLRELTDDILLRGILVPILQTENGEVLDGKLRLSIADEHRIFCPRIIIGKLSLEERADLRLCVNLYRRHMSREQVRHLVEWRLRQEPESSDRCVAKKCGVSDKTVGSVRTQLGAELPQVNNRLGADGKRYPSARKPVIFTGSDSQAREASRLLGELGDHAPDKPINVRDLRTLRYEQVRDELLSRTTGRIKLGDDFKIHCCDFRKLGSQIEPGTVSLVLTDPPWEAKLGPEIAEAVVRLLKPDGILACFTGTYFLPYFIEHFKAAELRYEWTVADVHRFRAIRNAGQVKSQWSPIVIFRKEPRGRLQLNQVLEDVLRFEDVDKSLHPWQQSLATSAALVRSLSRPGDLTCDLFVGSGTVPAAVAQVGEGRRFAGCEIDPKLVKAARARVAEALSGRRAELEPEALTV